MTEARKEEEISKVKNSYPGWFTPLNYKNQRKGTAEIKNVISSGHFFMEAMRVIRDQGPRWLCPAGRYTQLIIDGKLVMSDTPGEAWAHDRFLCHAEGKVLINGLGLGMIARAVLNWPEVTHVHVVEINQDVVDMVVPYLNRDNTRGIPLKVTIADALKFKPDAVYDAVWHDIWPMFLDEETWKQREALHRKWRGQCTWQGSWSEDHFIWEQQGETFLPEPEVFKGLLDGTIDACSDEFEVF